MSDIKQLKEMAQEMKGRYGEQWRSALCESGDYSGNAKRYHAVISDQNDDLFIKTDDDSLENSWLCDYLEAVSPAAILELVEHLEKAEKDFQSLDKQMSYLEQECTRQRDQLVERDPQIAALTAENVALKELVSDYAKHKTAFDDFDGDRRGIAEHLYEAEQALLSDHETPATNAAANALRAEGVEMAISQALRDGIPINRMQFIARITNFANQLREGK